MMPMFGCEVFYQTTSHSLNTFNLSYINNRISGLINFKLKISVAGIESVASTETWKS